jgi:hypothetical protein
VESVKEKKVRKMDTSTEEVPIGWDLYFPGEEYQPGDPRYPFIFTMFEWLNEKFDDNELSEVELAFFTCLHFSS